MTFAALAATEAPAERLNLLELVGPGARRAAHPQQGAANSRRKPIRVEPVPVAEAKAAKAPAPALSSIAAEALAQTNVVKAAPIVMTNFVERVVTNVIDRVVDRVSTNFVDRVIDRVTTNYIDRVIDRVETNYVDRVIDRVATNYIDRVIDRVTTNYIDRVETNFVDRVATNFVDRVVTNVIERMVTNVVAKSTITTNALGQVVIEREPGPPRITSKMTYYDRKEGYAVFSGKVHVDTEEYQLHAQRAYVFFEGTNELKRIVATGNVAITNETKRAYGTKASYYRNTGMVVLYGDDKSPAEVRDEAKKENQVVKGSKIKFWTTSEQIEVVDARISAPVDGGVGEIKKGLLPK